jgi:hypothetical protein
LRFQEQSVLRQETGCLASGNGELSFQERSVLRWGIVCPALGNGVSCGGEPRVLRWEMGCLAWGTSGSAVGNNWSCGRERRVVVSPAAGPAIGNRRACPRTDGSMSPAATEPVSDNGYASGRKRVFTRTDLVRLTQSITRSASSQRALERRVAMTGFPFEMTPRGIHCLTPLVASGSPRAAVRRRCWDHIVSATEMSPVRGASNWSPQTRVTRTERWGIMDVFTERLLASCASRHVSPAGRPVARHESSVLSDGANQ